MQSSFQGPTRGAFGSSFALNLQHVDARREEMGPFLTNSHMRSVSLSVLPKPPAMDEFSHPLVTQLWRLHGAALSHEYEKLPGRPEGRALGAEGQPCFQDGPRGSSCDQMVMKSLREEANSFLVLPCNASILP